MGSERELEDVYEENVRDKEMSRARGTNRGEETSSQFWWENLKSIDCLEDLG